MKNENQVLISIVKNLAAVLTKSELHSSDNPVVIDVAYCLWKLEGALSSDDSFISDELLSKLAAFSDDLNNHLFAK